MNVFAIKAAGRVALRRSPLQNTKSSITKRFQTTSPPKSKVSNDPTNGTSIPIPNTVATLPLWQRLGPLSSGFRAYAKSQQKRPYATQFVSSLVIFFLGDLSAQSIAGNEYDPIRSGRALIISGMASIPSYKWFLFLGNHFNYSSKTLSLATKVVVNQAAFTPVNNSFFFGMQSFLSGDSLPEVWTRIKRTVPVSMINSVKVWPAITAFSFTFIDAQYRSIFAGVIAIGWQTYLSYLNKTAEDEEALQNMIRESGSGEKSRTETVQQQREAQKAEV